MPMRQLVACPECALQFDAAGREPGSRMRCACGAVIEVPQPRPHDAAVVRCASCGAPRQERAAACGFCGADFTLHERDLHTICPGCMSRISDRGRFCHACGLAIAPQAAPGEATELACPACGDERRLTSRRLDGAAAAVLECGRCAGLWLGNDLFRRLEGRALARSGDEALGEATPPPREPPPATEPPRYRPCPVCRKLMHRRNYGEKSGVILDTCRAHGLWFDRDELDRVLTWITAGGPQRVERRRAEEAAERARHRRLFPPPTTELEIPARGGASTLAELVRRLVELLS